MEILVPKPKLEEMMSKVSCSTIRERNRVKGTVFFQKKEYVLVSSCSSYLEGIISVTGYKATLLSLYQGSLKPLTLLEHDREIDQGKRERGYYGLLTQDGNRWIVLESPRIEFKPLKDSGKQLNLF